MLCWPRGRGIGLLCARRFSFHYFYNFRYLIFIHFEDFFLPTTLTHTHTHDPRPTTFTHYPRPTTFNYTQLTKLSKLRLRLRIFKWSNEKRMAEWPDGELVLSNNGIVFVFCMIFTVKFIKVEIRVWIQITRIRRIFTRKTTLTTQSRSHVVWNVKTKHTKLKTQAY